MDEDVFLEDKNSASNWIRQAVRLRPNLPPRHYRCDEEHNPHTSDVILLRIPMISHMH